MRTRALRQSLRIASIAATEALACYRLDVMRRQLLAHTHNTTYRLTMRDGSRAVLKIRPAAGDGAAELLSEMQWLDALSRETELLVPRPIRNRAGELVTDVNVNGAGRPHRCRMMSWVPGRKLGRALKAKHFGLLGELIAGLHEHAGRFSPPRGFVRLRWEEELERRFAHVERAAREGRLSPERMRVFNAAIGRARRAMRQVGYRPDVYRLIHADLGFTNHVYHQGRAGAIDFEICGYGWLLQDLVEPLCFLQHVKHFAVFRDALLSGYRRVRPMPTEMERFLPDFIDFSTMTSLGYMCGEPSRAGDLRWISGYLAKALRPPARAVAK
jgi:Ser/Thr protein kinase RdoA (MazF antagonist)